MKKNCPFKGDSFCNIFSILLAVVYLIRLSIPPPCSDSLRDELSSRIVFDFKTDSVVYIAFTANGTESLLSEAVNNDRKLHKNKLFLLSLYYSADPHQRNFDRINSFT